MASRPGQDKRQVQGGNAGLQPRAGAGRRLGNGALPGRVRGTGPEKSQKRESKEDAMSNAHLPPVPPENRSPHGGSNAGKGEISSKEAKANATQRDPSQQGRQGNTHQNTTHQGYQQDR